MGHQIMEECWPAALAQQLARECGAGLMAVPGWARGIEKDLTESDGDREWVESKWRLQLGLQEDGR